MLSRYRKAFVWACMALWLLLVWQGSAQAQSAPAALLESARAQIAAGAADAAYDALLREEGNFAGDPDFDYLLGLAALESGRPDAATFAFERVLTVDPSYFGARVDMARAYFVLGNDDLAKTEFETLRSLDPPPAAARVIDQYLDAIEERNALTRLSYFIEAEFGYDTNANAATSEGNVFVPALNTVVTLDASSASSEDWFGRARAGMNVRHKWDDTATLRARVAAQYNDFFTTDGFETRDLDFGIGLDLTYGEDIFKLDASGQHQKLDWVEYQVVAGVSAQWQRTWNKLTQTTLFGQHSRIRYRRADDRSNDSNLTLGGVSLLRALDDNGNLLVSVNAFAGLDSERNTRLDGGRKLFGSQIAAQYRLTDSAIAFASAGAQVSIYDRVNTLFNVRRKDEQLDLSLGLSWQPADNWRIQPRVSLRRNISNARFNAYERATAGLTIRREF